jgi:disulfide bond formation protein DsbB
VVLSWWSWWYGGSFGLRAFIESYAFLALPLAALVSLIIKQRRLIKLPALIIIICFALYGLFTNIQYYYEAIHWDSMTKEAYWSSFGRAKPQSNFKELIKAPDYDNAIKGIEEYSGEE